MTEATEALRTLLSPIVNGNIYTVAAEQTTKPPYIVLTPVDDDYNAHADDEPQGWTEEVLISIYTVTNYKTIAEAVCTACINAGFAITERKFIEREDKTKYYHYAITVEHDY